MPETAKSSILVCPETKIPVRETSLEEATTRICGEASLATQNTNRATPFGPTEQVMIRDDDGCAYPIVDGVPILMRPEMLTAPDHVQEIDLWDMRYAEAYEEMDHYNDMAREEAKHLGQPGSMMDGILSRVHNATAEQIASFPNPLEVWLDAIYDSRAQYDCYQHISTIKGKRILQLGGQGSHAVKFLIGGAAETWAFSPMVGEQVCAMALARRWNVQDRLCCATGVAEELPFEADSFDAVAAFGCVHHMVTELALAECARVLKPGGVFVAAEPWKAPFYTLGTRVLGKREPNVYCRPMVANRVAPLFEHFDDGAVIHHGTLTRYGLLGLKKFGLRMPLKLAWRVFRVDDALCSIVPPLRRIGSSISMLGTKTASPTGTTGNASSAPQPAASAPDKTER